MNAQTYAPRLVENGEWHLERRFRILADHPEIKDLYGYDPTTATKTAVVAIGHFGIAYALAFAHSTNHWLGSFWFLLAASWLIGALAAKWSGVAIHEASHNVVLRTARANKVFSVLANTLVLVPSAMTFRRHHLKHHTHMGILGVDNDIAMQFEQKYLSQTPLRKLVWLTFYVFFGTLARGFLRKPTREEVCNFVFIAAFDVAVFWVVGPWGILYLALSVFFGFGLHPVAGHFIHEHYIWSPGQETYSYYGPLNAVTLNLGYHVEHHDFMGVPSARLRRLHAIAKHHYAPLVHCTSWTAIMWRFMTSPSLGHFSRYVRTEKTRRRSRAKHRAALKANRVDKYDDLPRTQALHVSPRANEPREHA